MKYLNGLAEALTRHESDPEYCRQLVRLLQAHDATIDLRVREEYGQLIHRDQLAEGIAEGMRAAVTAIVEACCDQRGVSPGLREEIEDAFAELLERSIRRAKAKTDEQAVS